MDFARVLPWVLLAVLFIVELPAVGRRRPEGQKRDAGSFIVVNVAFTMAFFASFWLSARGTGAIGGSTATVLRVAGIVLAAGGAALRTWAISTLGRFFTRTVQVSNDQPVIQEGPYRLIRHPSYTGLGMIVLGVAFALTNYFALALLIPAMCLAGIYRIRVEEAALTAAIGPPYADYMQRTRRLIPYVI